MTKQQISKQDISKIQAAFDFAAVLHEGQYRASRVYEHKNKLYEGFSKKYNLKKLVYYEIFDDITLTIEREKYLKGKTRKFKNDLVNNK